MLKDLQPEWWTMNDQTNQRTTKWTNDAKNAFYINLMLATGTLLVATCYDGESHIQNALHLLNWVHE